jgi:hypothetical protein
MDEQSKMIVPMVVQEPVYSIMQTGKAKRNGFHSPRSTNKQQTTNKHQVVDAPPNQSREMRDEGGTRRWVE